MRGKGVDAEEALDFVNRVCRKRNEEEERDCCRSCWNSWFTKVELGYNTDAGIEAGIESTVLVGVNG